MSKIIQYKPKKPWGLHLPNFNRRREPSVKTQLSKAGKTARHFVPSKTVYNENGGWAKLLNN